MTLRAALTTALLAAAACAPSLPGSYHCDRSSQCTLGGAQGTCEPSGACSFPDGSCASGRRYGQYGPAGLAGACVDPGNSGPVDLALGGDDGGVHPLITRVGTSKLAPAARMTAVTVPAPSGLAAGDLLLACLYADDNTTSFTPPPGWSQHLELGGNLTGNFHAQWFDRVAAPGEPASYVFALNSANGSSTVAAAVAAYRGVAPAAPFDAAGSRQFQGTPFVAPSITTTRPNDMLVAMFVDQTQGIVLKAPSGMSAAVEDQAIYFFDALQPLAGASGTKPTGNQLPGIGGVDFVALAPAP